jgi:hypothetical protein
VQPVLDRHCVSCHDSSAATKPPSLRGDRFGKYGWSEAFHSLRPYAWGMSGGNGVALKERQYSLPGQVGARASRLHALLLRRGYDRKLPPEDWYRITLWLDCNSNFYGAYHEPSAQARGEIVRPQFGVPRWSVFEDLAR